MEGTATISIEDLLYYKEIEKTLKSNENFTYLIDDETGRLQRFSIIAKSKLTQAHIKTNRELVNKLNANIAASLKITALIDSIEAKVEEAELLHKNEVEQLNSSYNSLKESYDQLIKEYTSLQKLNDVYWDRIKENSHTLHKLNSRGFWARLWNRS